MGMGQNVGELVTGSPVSWWTCVKASDAHSRILVSHRLSILLAHQGLFIEDLRRLYLQVSLISHSRSSASSAAIVLRACVTDCNGIPRIHARNLVVPHVRARSYFCLWAWTSPKRKKYLGPRWYLLLYFDSQRCIYIVSWRQ